MRLIKYIYNWLPQKKKRLLIRVTNKCNLACIHCLSNSTKSYSNKNYNTNVVISKLDSLICGGNNYHELAISGGEATLEKEKIRNILRHLFTIRRITASKISIITNGVGIDDTLAFAEGLITLYGISIDIKVSNTRFHIAERGTDLEDLLTLGDIKLHTRSGAQLSVTIIDDEFGIGATMYHQGRAIMNKQVIKDTYGIVVKDDGKYSDWYTDKYNVQESTTWSWRSMEFSTSTEYPKNIKD